MNIKYLIPTNEPQECTENTIFLDNSYGKSIFEKYNKGVELCKDSDVIVFMHDDVEIVDENTEKKLEMVFSSFPNIGIIGIIGTKVFNAAGGWWMCRRGVDTVGHIIQGYPDGRFSHMVDKIGFSKEMVSVDGCFFAVRASAFTSGKIKFDEDFTGYHHYDCDICFQALEKGYDIAVADIAVKHASEGPLTNGWNLNRDLLIEKWELKGYTFPITKNSFSK